MCIIRIFSNQTFTPNSRNLIPQTWFQQIHIMYTWWSRGTVLLPEIYRYKYVTLLSLIKHLPSGYSDRQNTRYCISLRLCGLLWFKSAFEQRRTVFSLCQPLQLDKHSWYWVKVICISIWFCFRNGSFCGTQISRLRVNSVSKYI